MKITDLNLKKITSIEILSLYQSKELSFDKTQRKILQSEIKSSIIDGKFVVARNATIIGLLSCEDETLKTIKGKGLFRYSRSIEGKSIIGALAKSLFDFLKDTELVASLTIKYLKTITLFSFILKEHQHLRLEIFKEFSLFQRRYPRKSLLKTLLANVDYRFLVNYFPDPIEKENMSSIDNKTKEDICSATSHLVYLLSTIKTFTDFDGGEVEDQYLTSYNINKVVIMACLIEEYKEIEVLIDHYVDIPSHSTPMIPLYSTAVVPVIVHQ